LFFFIRFAEIVAAMSTCVFIVVFVIVFCVVGIDGENEFSEPACVKTVRFDGRR
jgi:uncharacterized membrane protein YhaH (DUF805 family)